MTNQEQINEFASHYPGWSDLAHKLNKLLSDNNKTIDQIKEKFGCIRCYFSPVPDKQLYDKIVSIENESGEVCCKCGEPGRVSSWGRYWMLCLCETCGEKRRKDT